MFSHIHYIVHFQPLIDECASAASNWIYVQNSCHKSRMYAIGTVQLLLLFIIYFSFYFIEFTNQFLHYLSCRHNFDYNSLWSEYNVISVSLLFLQKWWTKTRKKLTVSNDISLEWFSVTSSHMSFVTFDQKPAAWLDALGGGDHWRCSSRMSYVYIFCVVAPGAWVFKMMSCGCYRIRKLLFIFIVFLTTW